MKFAFAALFSHIINLQFSITLFPPTQQIPLQKRTCFISDYVSDPSNATVGIQAALRDCGSCGGTVYFDLNATYVTGALIATGSLHINMSAGATLAASTLQSDFPGPKSDWYLLRFQNCTNCVLSCGGTFDGRARLWVTGQGDGRKTLRTFNHSSCSDNLIECRPRLLGAVDSTAIAIDNLRIIDPVYWTVHILRSTDVQISNINITGDWMIPNNDGIDIDSSSDVIIRDCTIDTADDAICLKTSHLDMPTERIQIKNCTLRSRSSAVKIGSESVADIKHIVATDLTILEAHRGLAIQLRDEGSVHHVVFSRIMMHKIRHMHPSWWGAGEPVYITAIPRGQGRKVGNVDGIEITHVYAEAENGIFISGAAGGGLVRNVAIRDMQLKMEELSDWLGGRQDYRPSYMGDIVSGSTAAMWVEYAERVLFEGVKTEYYAPRRKDWKKVLHINESNTKGIHLHGCQFTNVTSRTTGGVDSM